MLRADFGTYLIAYGGERDGLLGTDATARGATAFASVLILDDQAIQTVNAVDAEQAEIQALHAIRAAAVINHRIPATTNIVTRDHVRLSAHLITRTHDRPLGRSIHALTTGEMQTLYGMLDDWENRPPDWDAKLGKMAAALDADLDFQGQPDADPVPPADGDYLPDDEIPF